jgi:hypothetical protein
MTGNQHIIDLLSSLKIIFRVPLNPQQENTSPSANLLSQSGSNVENLMEVEGLKKQDSKKEYYVDAGIKKEYKDEAEKVEAEKVEAEKVEAETVEAEKVEQGKVEAEKEKVASNSPSKRKGKVSNFDFV